MALQSIVVDCCRPTLATLWLLLSPGARLSNLDSQVPDCIIIQLELYVNSVGRNNLMINVHTRVALTLTQCFRFRREEVVQWVYSFPGHPLNAYLDSSGFKYSTTSQLSGLGIKTPCLILWLGSVIDVCTCTNNTQTPSLPSHRDVSSFESQKGVLINTPTVKIQMYLPWYSAPTVCTATLTHF